MISYLHNMISSIVPIEGLSTADDGSIIVHYIDTPTPEQYLQINAILNSLDLQLAKFNKLEELEQSWKTSILNGWETPEGWKLGLDTQDVTLLTGAFILAKEAADAGITNSTSIIDTAGEPHQLTIQELTSLMLQYGSARATLSADYANKKHAIHNATSISELESI